MTTPGRSKPTSRKKPTRKKKQDRRRTQPVVTVPGTDKVEFPEVKGKTLESLRLSLDTDDSGISLTFQDKTHLDFDIEPFFTVRTEYSDSKTGSLRKIRRWPPLSSTSLWVKW